MKENQSVRKYIHTLAFLFMAILLFAGKGYLLSRPFLSGLLLLSFSTLYLVSVLISKRGCFVYPLVSLFVVSYYLWAYGLGIPSFYYPVLSIPIVLALYLIARASRAVDEIRPALYTSAQAVATLFTFYILYKVSAYIQTNTWAAILPLLAFAALYFMRYLETRKVLHQYNLLLLFSFAYILTLYAIRPLPRPYYGLFLIGLCMAMMGIGNYYHNSLGFSQVRPLYVVGQTVSLVAFLYAYREPSALLPSLLLFSINSFGISRSVSLKPTASRPQELLFYKGSFGLANFASSVCLVLLLYYGFPRTWAVLITLIGYTFFYFTVAMGRERTFLKVRSQYIYLSGLYFTAFYFTGLSMANPIGGLQRNMVLGLPLILLYLALGRWMEGKGPVLANSIYEASYFPLVASLFLPIIARDHQVAISSVIGLLSLSLYCLFIYLTKNEALYYSGPIAFSSLYYDLQVGLGMDKVLLSITFVPVGLLAMGFALIFHRRESPATRPFYLAWFLLSGISLYTAAPYRLMNLYILTFWAIAYVIGAQLIPVVENGEALAQRHTG